MKTNPNTRKVVFAALMAALCYIGFSFFRIDIPVGTEKTAFHLGNVFCVLAALLIGAFWAQTEDPSGCGAASPSQGRWDPDSLRPALSLGGQATAGERSPGRSLCLTKSSACAILCAVFVFIVGSPGYLILSLATSFLMVVAVSDISFSSTFVAVGNRL